MTKICDYCSARVDDSVVACPNCNSGVFRPEVPSQPQGQATHNNYQGGQPGYPGPPPPYQQQGYQQQGYQQPGYQTAPPYQSYAQPQQLAQTQEALFFQKVYFWMCGALAVTAITSLILARSFAWYRFVAQGTVSVIIIIAVQIGLVIAINALMDKISPIGIKALFLLFAVSMGFTTSIVLLVYPMGVITKAFFTAAVTYAAMATYGLVTKRSLQAWGSFLFMGVIGLIAASILNLFLGSDSVDFVICCVGVLIFAGLTAYDHQKLRVMYATDSQAFGSEDNLVTYGALTLYLDFINLFLFLVRLFGRE
ncbi:MAG: Bax inhibitor-1/YccA family protein [Deltaproteobacteria bacterium]|jgi:FtsH-binding integral membrane protein|nr:Bax inhibitor-1/YccA family protein [Deltaproteobacteria bacterium]